jgi:hypothetical protein
MDAWKHFLELINRAIKPTESLTTQVEEQFLSAKARIAMLHDSFMASLKHDKQTGQNMIDLVNRSLSLRSLQQANEAEQKKVEIEWHEVFLLLNETVSSLNEERARLADMNQITHNLGRMQERLVANVKGFTKSIWFKLIVAASVFVFVVFVVPALGIYDYDNLRDIRAMKPVIGGYFDISRDMLGFKMPYIDKDAYIEKAKAIVKPDPNHVLEPYDFGQDRFFQNFAQFFPAGSPTARQEAADLLKQAEYDAFQLKEKSGNQAKANMYVFWFRKTPNANKAMVAIKDLNNTSDRVDVMQRVNVITIMNGTTPSNLRILKDDFLEKIPPN